MRFPFFKKRKNSGWAEYSKRRITVDKRKIAVIKTTSVDDNIPDMCIPLNAIIDIKAKNHETGEYVELSGRVSDMIVDIFDNLGLGVKIKLDTSSVINRGSAIVYLFDASMHIDEKTYNDILINGIHINFHGNETMLLKFDMIHRYFLEEYEEDKYKNTNIVKRCILYTGDAITVHKNDLDAICKHEWFGRIIDIYNPLYVNDEGLTMENSSALCIIMDCSSTFNEIVTTVTLDSLTQIFEVNLVQDDECKIVLIDHSYEMKKLQE